MQQENIAKDLFNNRKVPFILDLKNSQQPHHIFVHIDGIAQSFAQFFEDSMANHNL